MEMLLLPFQFPFMQKAFVIGAIIAVPCALISCFLVLKGWALMGDALSHAVLPGIVLAYIGGLPLILGAFFAALFTAGATGFLGRNSRVKEDAVMGVVFSGMFALGIVLNVAIPSDAHLDHILFGNLLGVGTGDLWTAGAIGVFVTLVLLAKWKDLMVQAFDPAHAAAIGLPVGWLHYGLLTLMSLTIVATLSVSGLILAVGLLIAPGACAFLLTRRFAVMMGLSVAICLFSLLSGIYLSFFLDSAPAPTAILVLTVIFMAALAIKLMRTRARPASI